MPPQHLIRKHPRLEAEPVHRWKSGLPSIGQPKLESQRSLKAGKVVTAESKRNGNRGPYGRDLRTKVEVETELRINRRRCRVPDFSAVTVRLREGPLPPRRSHLPPRHPLAPTSGWLEPIHKLHHLVHKNRPSSHRESVLHQRALRALGLHQRYLPDNYQSRLISVPPEARRVLAVTLKLVRLVARVP